MKKYIKPQIEIKEFEVSDIITVSGGLFSGLANLNKSESTTFDDSILDPEEIF